MSLRRHAGFSLIELMIVIVIIGVLAGISLPSYQSYLEKAKFTQVITSTQPFKLAVSLGLQQGDSLAELNSGEMGVPSYSEENANINNIQVNSGIITATASAKAGSYTYILTPNLTGSHWDISGTCIDAGLCKGA
jgi:type IV pilus assembly protein PilA